MPGDNPVYEPGSTINELKGMGSSPHTITAVTILPDQQELKDLSPAWKRGDLTTPYMVTMILMRQMIVTLMMSTRLLLISKINSLYQIMSLTTQFMELKHTIAKHLHAHL